VRWIVTPLSTGEKEDISPGPCSVRPGLKFLVSEFAVGASHNESDAGAEDQPEWLDERFYLTKIQPRLAYLSMSAIASALCVSMAVCRRNSLGQVLLRTNVIGCLWHD